MTVVVATLAPPKTKASKSAAPRRPAATKLLQYYPVTTLMAGPYITLILPQAWYYGNPKAGFIWLLLGLALGGSLLIETVFILLRPPFRTTADRIESNGQYPRIVRVAAAVAVIGTAADIIKVLAGGGTIDSQITGRAAESPIVSLMTPFWGFKYMGLALLTSACLGGFLARRRYHQWLLGMIAAQVVIATYTALTAALISFVSFVILSCLMFGLIYTRLVMVIAVVVIAAWPAIYSVRNDIRISKGIAVSTDLTAAERLRFDEQVTRAAGYEVPARIPELIGPSDIVRYGVLPRALDSNRPLLATGGLMSDYIGGSRTNMWTFLPLGTIYFLMGPMGPVLFYGGAAFAFILLLRTGRGPGPVRLMMIYLAVSGPLSWTSSYPESLVSYIQSLVSMVPIWLALRTFGVAPKVSG